jgi:hypothetical protein
LRSGHQHQASQGSGPWVGPPTSRS